MPYDSTYPIDTPMMAMADADIGAAERTLVNEVLQSRVLSCGPMAERFELEWAERLGVRHAVAVSSGTAALHLAMIAAGVGDGDFVVTSPYSFVASANAILYQRAVPIFVDIDPESFNIDQSQVAEALGDLASGGRAGRRWLPRRGAGEARAARAVLPVHVFGRMAAMPEIMSAARAHGAEVIEDACEAIGAEQGGRVAGTFGDASVFGFFPNKQLAMGEGGVIATDNGEWAALFRSLRNQGRNAAGDWLEYPRLGFNYRLAEMSAAIGLGQLRRLEELLAKRAHVAAAYTSRLKIEGVTPIGPTLGTSRMSWFVYVVRFLSGISRDAVMNALAARGIPTRAYFPAIHLQSYYRDRFAFEDGDFPVAEAVSRSTLALPFHANMTSDAVDIVVAALGDAVHGARRAGVPPSRQARGTGASLASAATRVTSFEHASQAAPPGSAMAVDLVALTRGEPAHSGHSTAVWNARHAPMIDLADEELLRRPLVSLPLDDVRALVGGQRVVVTGAGGSIGSELCRQLAECAPSSLVMVDRYENGLHAVAASLARHAFARAVIGDVTDAARLEAIMSASRPQLVLHAAAHKHVPLMEDHPCEAVKNNVIGTGMVLDAAIRFGARQFVLISTDKAVRPANVMGATKRAAELIVQRAGRATDTRCVIVRFGNVLGSNGSVLHTFIAQVQAGGPLTVTHPDVRRYFMLVSEAAHLVLHAAARAPQGSIAVLDIGEQIPIVALAEHVIRRFGYRLEQIPIVFTGLRPGEKLSEELVGDGEELVRSEIAGVGCVAAPAGRDWLTFDRHLRALERFAREGAVDMTRAALERLLR